MSNTEIEKITVIGIQGTSKDRISSLKGIEYFVNLTKLRCIYNDVTELDLSKLSKLTHLYCDNNNLNKLDVSKNTSLQILECQWNNLNELDVSKNIHLTQLDCDNNNLSELDISKNKELTALYCTDNNLSKLDVSKNKELTYLFCYDNNLSELDVSNNINLQFFGCNGKSLESLDVSKNTQLESLYCTNTSISKLDVSNNVKLRRLACTGNNISELDISNNVKLNELECYNTNISKLDISKHINLTKLKCYGTNISELDISNNIKLNELECYNTNISELDVSKHTDLTNLRCYDTDISELDVSNHTYLTELYCYNTNISKLNVSKSMNLTELYCYNTNISELDVSKNTGLTKLYCHSNNISELDISKNVKLVRLNCSSNSLKELNVSNNTNLTYLYCNGNNISELDISKNTSLIQFECGKNNINNLDTTKNTSLEILYCNNNKLSKLDVSKNINLYRLTCDNNNLNELDISQLINLVILECESNKLSKLDVSKNVLLTKIYCNNNDLETLDVSKNTLLVEARCNSNYFSKLDFSNNNKLQYLNCEDNTLITLNLKNNTNIFWSSGFLLPDYAEMTVYCTADTWVESYCKENDIRYSTGEPEEDSEAEEEDKPPVVLIDIKDAVINCANTYLKVKKNDAPQVPKLNSVTLNGKKLKKNRDFTVSYTFNGKDVDKLTVCGKYSMTITGKGKYTGSKSISITVTEKTLLSKTTIKLNSVEYTGKPVTSGVVKSVKFNKVILEEGKDYTLSYKNNVNSGKGTVIIKAKDSSDYAGVVEKNFNIKGIKLSNVKVSGVTSLPCNINGKTVHDSSDIVVKYKQEILILDKDYIISYENNDHAGNAKVVFTGIGKYNGTLKKSFKIIPVQMSKVTLDSAEITAVYKKTGAKPDVKLTYNGVKLVNGKDYKLSYSNNKKITTDTKKAKIVIKGIGNYKGTLSKQFDIIQKTIASSSVIIKAEDVKYKEGKQTYTTKVKVYDNGVLLKENKDYKITFKKTVFLNIWSLGSTDTFVIEGIGNYKGSRTGTFRIVYE